MCVNNVGRTSAPHNDNIHGYKITRPIIPDHIPIIEKEE